MSDPNSPRRRPGRPRRDPAAGADRGNLFRGPRPTTRLAIFGGQVIAQSLLAAYETIESRVCHSLHCYSSGPATPRCRSSSRWTVARWRQFHDPPRGGDPARQADLQPAASFKDPEEGFFHQAAMPQGPHWSGSRTSRRSCAS
jgi:acyl-CoA thioesterase-2